MSESDTDHDTSTPSEKETDLTMSLQEDDTERQCLRKRRRQSRKNKYFAGLSRRAHRPHRDVNMSIEELSFEATTSLDGVCKVCSETLEVAFTKWFGKVLS